MSIEKFDLDLLLSIHQRLQNSFFDTVMPVITYLGNVGAIWFIIALVLIGIKKYRPVGIMIFVAMGIGFIIGDIGIKHLVARPRPFVTYPVDLLITAPASFSFPSGHSLSSFAAATVIARSIPRLSLPIFILAALIAFSRVYLFVHYPLDVIVGLIIGVSIGWLVTGLWKRIKRRSQLSTNTEPL